MRSALPKCHSALLKLAECYTTLRVFMDFFCEFFVTIFLGLSVFRSQFGVCLQKFGGSRPAAQTVHKGLANNNNNNKVVYRTAKSTISRLKISISIFGIWDMGYGLWDMGYGIWDMGYGIWDMGYLINNVLSKLLECSS
jgi:hypothetical protein